MQTPTRKSHGLSPNSPRLTAATLLVCLAASALAQSNDTAAPTQRAQPATDVAAQTSPAQQGGGAGSDRRASQQQPQQGGGFQSAGNVQGTGFQGGFQQQQAAPSAPLPKVPEKLEDMLALALRSNPEILLAESKLRQAQSELNQVRLKVTEQVVTLYHERGKQEELLAQLNQQLKLVRSAFQAGQTPSEKVIEATIARSSAAAAVPQIEAQTRYLLGLGGDTPASLPTTQSTPHSEVAPTAPRPEVPEKFRTILDMPANFDFDESRLEDVLDFFSAQYKVPFLIDGAAQLAVGGDAPVNFAAHDLTLRQTLGAMLDVGFSNAQAYELCFVIRDYGILVSTPERARNLYGATIPPEIPMNASAVPPQ